MAERLHRGSGWRAPILALSLVSSAAFAAPLADPADALLGRWHAADAPEAVIEIRESDAGLYQGRIVSHADRPASVGTHIFRDLRYDPADQRWRGRVYAPKLDRELEAGIARDTDDRFTLTVSSWLGQRRVQWMRVP